MFSARYLHFIHILFLSLPTWAGVGPRPKVAQTIFCNAQRAPITPENTIFAFDFHDVISYGWPTLGTSLRIIWGSPYRSTILKYSPTLLYTLFSMRRQMSVAEQGFQKIITLYPELEPCRTTFLEVANAQRPNKKTQAIMKELHDKGFKLYLFSNIGEVTFADLQERHPELLNYLDGFCIVKAPDYNAKPDPRMYQQFKDQFNPDGSKQIVFVDDRLKNIKAGCNAGMISILFEDADKLYRDLTTLGINFYPSDSQPMPINSQTTPSSSYSYGIPVTIPTFLGPQKQ